MGRASSVSASLLATSARSSGGRGGSCDTTCTIIVATTVGGFFGCIILLLCLCYFMFRREEKKRKVQVIQLAPVRSPDDRDRIDKLEKKLAEYLNANPHILDMSDRKIPDYIKEHVPDLTAKELEDVILVIAARRVALV